MIERMAYLLFALTGLISGFLAGLLGIGGGMVTISCLVFIFGLIHFPPEHMMHFAIGTSLASMIFGTFISMWSHHRRKGVIWHIVRAMLIGAVVGAGIGALTSSFLSSQFLKTFFGSAAIAFGLYYIWRAKRAVVVEGDRLPSSIVLSAMTVPISLLSTLLGIGGGIFTSPLLAHYHVPMNRAIGTSSAMSFFITLFGALAFFITGEAIQVEMPNTLGFLYLPAFFIIAPAAALSSPSGAKLAHALPQRTLKRLFGLMLILAGVLVLWK